MLDEERTIRPDTHLGLGWRWVHGFGFARRLALQALAVEEIVRVAQVMPVVFRRDAAAWQAVAVMGPVAGANVYVAPDGHWRGHFVPAALRVYPFALAAHDDACLALWSGVEPEPLAGGAGDSVLPFFEDGHYSPLLQKTLAFLRQLKRGQAAAAAPLARVQAMGLLTPWRVPVGDAAVQTLDGLYCLDAATFAALEDAAWLELRRLGALEWLYAHLHSLHHAERFAALASRSARVPKWAPEESDEQQQATTLLAAMFAGLEVE